MDAHTAAPCDPASGTASGRTLGAATVAVLVSLILALSASPVRAQATANIDFYIAVSTNGDGSFSYSYPVLSADGSYRGASVVVPGEKFGDNGIAPSDDTIEGAPELRAALEAAVEGTNATYSPSQLRFRIRSVYFIRADQAQIGRFFDAEQGVWSLGMVKKKSGLHAAFGQATAANTGAFRVLVADIDGQSGESGIAANGGTTSVVSGGQLLDTHNNGFILSHELGHNLNLPHSGNDPFIDIMSETEPARGPTGAGNRPIETMLTEQQRGLVDDGVKSGVLGPVLNSPDRRSSQVQPDGTAPTFSVWSNVGGMDRGEISFLRTELGGNVANPRFGAVDRDDSFASFGASAAIPVPGTDISGLTAFVAASFGWSESSISTEFLSADGNQLGILGVETEGYVTAAGFGDVGDVTDLAYDDRYQELLFRAGVSADTRGVGAVQFRPRAALIYGRTDEDSSFSGVTNGGTFFFDYDGQLESNRFGAELGFDAQMPLGPDGFGVYAGAALRLIQNFADGRVSLETNLPSFEQRTLSESQFDLGGTASAGLSYRNGPLTARAGLDFETWQVPTLDVTGTDPARIEFQARNSLAVGVEIGIAF